MSSDIFSNDPAASGQPAARVTGPDDLMVRVGCRLVYVANHPVPLVLNVRPRGDDPGHRIVSEGLWLGEDLPSEEFLDTHGNLMTRVVLQPGSSEIRHDALLLVSDAPDNFALSQANPTPAAELPLGLLRYTLPSRYCDSDKLLDFAWQKFGAVEPGRPRVQAICDWLHDNIEYRFGSGRPDLSASEVIARGHGVCRDFAHTGIALCRTFNLPARYVTGHLPDIGYIDPGSPMDFHAYFEVYLDGAWLTFDPRYNVPRIGRVKVSCGFDAVDGAFSTVYGAAQLAFFEVWAYQVAPGTVALGDPIDLTQRLDGCVDVRRQHPGGPGRPAAAAP